MVPRDVHLFRSFQLLGQDYMWLEASLYHGKIDTVLARFCVSEEPGLFVLVPLLGVSVTVRKAAIDVRLLLLVAHLLPLSTQNDHVLEHIVFRDLLPLLVASLQV